ncbi:tRNA (adenosine(37)-N6)-threonylcarbamoyltransferase complex ATPase subunit type 1 TsaE [Patescibacteria group bacterium]|nr:tRNA (adenosine(37)-N6)-threonylcarbamoyltransferase complex ATPase subunit type 1 TsaE [Patescibacteria group bacterium]MBU1728168.1 tRNA (adenosine(37)-N6)-threonylcarbamoyltransferase complex ATPase subunit type 1 TsaE [Patescibacteria group bacterium]
MQKISKKTEDTEQIVKGFLFSLKPISKKATIIGLYGDLGTGKTTFVQYFAKNLGIEKKVNSPTFVIMRRYVLKNKNFENLFHLDAYRLKNERELLHLGWEEVISNPKHLVCVEWPEKIKKAIPKKHYQIHISHTKEGHRKFKIKKA